MAHFSAIFFKSFCAAFDFKFSIYQFIGNGNDLNSNYDNTKWLQQHKLYQTVMKEVSNNKAFVKSNPVIYQSHDTNSIPKQFMRNNVR